MKIYKGFEKENGEIVDHAYIDGYWIGDRLLEGVFIKILVSDGKLRAEIREEDESYFKQLNKDYWLKEAVDFAINCDLFYSVDEDDELILVEA